MGQSKYTYQEFSGALQQKSTTHIKKPNEVRKAKNADFATVLGAVRRRKGAQSSAANMPKLPVNTGTLGAYIARFPSAVEIWAVQNNTDSSPSAAILQYWTGPGVTDWSNIYTGMVKNAEVNMIDDLDEVWIASYDPILDVIQPSFTVDAAHSRSTTRQLAYGPSARFFVPFGGSMWAADVLVDGNRFRDRLYKSSGPTGAVTFIRSPQTDPAASFTLTDQVPVMSSNTAPVGTAAASGEFSASFQAWRAFEGGTSQAFKWVAGSGQTTGWLRYDFGAGNTKVITHYSIVAVPSDEVQPNRAPRNWTFEGSNDGSSWTVLNTQTGIGSWGQGEKRQYATTNTTAYRYYRINVSAIQPGGDVLVITEAEFLSSTTNADLLEVQIDSARYIKPGLTVDIYKAGTETKLYTITPSEIDKINDTMRFVPYTQTFGISDVNTTTYVITLPDATSFTTGTPIIFASSGTLPTGLTAGTTYYAINVSGTTIKVATSALNASLGVAIDITATGSGSHRVRLSYVFGNKDEIWKSGRKGKLTRFWNTDYRNPEASDYIKLPASQDGQNAIVAVGSISNRLFPFTETSMFKFDGQNIIPLRNDVGCAAHKSIAYYDSFMIWLDNKGKIWLRNEEGGTQDVISEAIAETMALVPQSQLSQATAVCVDDTYKLYLGQIDGTTLRVVYNFRTNQWTVEWWKPKMQIQLEYRYGSDIHPHFFDELGQMWVDEQGTDDNGDAISFEFEPGDDNFGIDELKSWVGVKIYSKNATATKLYAQVDGGEWYDLGQITKRVEAISIAKLPKGTMINFKPVSSIKGDTPQIDKITVWFNREEDTFRATPR